MPGPRLKLAYGGGVRKKRYHDMRSDGEERATRLTKMANTENIKRSGMKGPKEARERGVWRGCSDRRMPEWS